MKPLEYVRLGCEYVAFMALFAFAAALWVVFPPPGIEKIRKEEANNCGC